MTLDMTLGEEMILIDGEQIVNLSINFCPLIKKDISTISNNNLNFEFCH